jgi:hypothetical protein
MAMKLFISWSGPVSQAIANEIRDWLPLVLPAVNPFITTSDVEKGARWQSEISKELNASSYGLACITSDNLASTWMAFEAGALTKELEQSRFATVLFGVGKAQVPAPFNMFQATDFNESEMRQLIEDINAAVPEANRRLIGHLDKSFRTFWPELSGKVQQILEQGVKVEAPEPNLADMLIEMMALLRQQSTVLSDLSTIVKPRTLSPIEQQLLGTRTSSGYLTPGSFLTGDAESILKLAQTVNLLKSGTPSNALASGSFPHTSEVPPHNTKPKATEGSNSDG